MIDDTIFRQISVNGEPRDTMRATGFATKIEIPVPVFIQGALPQ
jgi:hypothetical protein